MWLDQYKKTFVGMQVVIVAACIGVYLSMYRTWPPTVLFFLVLQAAAVAGAMWASRLKRKYGQNAR
jgi:CDP-diglyceride synthetase